MAEAVLPDGRHINKHNKRSAPVSNGGLQIPWWVCDGFLPFTNEFFPKPNHSLYRNMAAVELFEKFFDDEVLELIERERIL